MRSNLILFVLVLVLVNQNFIGTRDEHEYEDDDEGAICRACRAVAQRAKAAHPKPEH